MKFLIFLTILNMDLTRASELYHDQFIEYSMKYDRLYDNGYELLERFGIYINNMQMINQHNSEYEQGIHTYTLGEGPFTDMTNEEFKQRFRGVPPGSNSHNCTKFNASYSSVPSSIDWREHNAVTPVKNQGGCGSCWAFSSTGAIEGLHAIETGTLTSLSEQQIMDCSDDYGNMGCSGGWMTSAFEYMETSAQCSEKDYPYQEASSGDCNMCSSPTSNTQLTSCGYFAQYPGSGNSTVQNDMIYQLSKQPLSVAIAADSEKFQNYKSGVFNDETCYGGYLDHGVLVVAYDADTLTIKNSWGPDWGDNGYITFSRTSTSQPDAGICGVYLAAAYPTINSSSTKELNYYQKYYANAGICDIK